MMTYMLIKALHIVVMTLWIGGMLILAVAMTAWQKAPAAGMASSVRLLEAISGWNRKVTLPAMILTWITGVALTMMGNWPPSASLLLKGVFVLGLSALHGMQSGAMRRSLAQNTLIAPAILRHAAAFTLIALLASVVLVELKPL
ncbi:CopD family protein [Biostraticola tofi]|uniref:Protoporphyrinogen IX oxidase n=1 Tax=Biostraticola tofi TaxID=466109 RepID=A0A4V2W4T0_9GAMM|nr:CopD family protein [Biostraticola tofi]TCV96629.1 putative membrane protein [Biostraticola tofi]